MIDSIFLSSQYATECHICVRFINAVSMYSLLMLMSEFVMPENTYMRINVNLLKTKFILNYSDKLS